VASVDGVRPDLIVTDLSMPGFNGLVLLCQIAGFSNDS
jgi:CheY-like chemotaxis protein